MTEDTAPARGGGRGQNRGGGRGGRGRKGRNGPRGGGRGGGRSGRAQQQQTATVDTTDTRGAITVRGGGERGGRGASQRGGGRGRDNKSNSKGPKKTKNTKTNRPATNEDSKNEATKPAPESVKKDSSKGSKQKQQIAKGSKNVKGDDKKNSESKQKKQPPKPKQQENSKSFAPSIPPSQPQQTSDINYGKGQTIEILHVAEKPSIAQAIAKGLCRSGNSSYINKSLPVHVFSDHQPFPKAPHAKSCTHKVTSVAGHVFSVDFPPQFQSWDSTAPAELFHAPVVRKAQKGSVVRHLQDEAKGCDFIVLW